MFVLLTLSSVLCVALGALAWRLWTAYWRLVADIEEAGARFKLIADAIETLARRDVLSNDATVVQFLKHIKSAQKMIDTLVERWSADNTDENDQA